VSKHRKRTRKSRLKIGLPVTVRMAEDRAVGPTPETAAKLKPDPILTMRRQKANPLWGEDVMAAEEIRRVYVFLVSGMFAKAQRLEAGIAGHDSERVPLAMIDANRRYTVWRKWAEVQHKRGGLPYLPVTIDVVVDGLSCAQVDANRRWRKGNASTALREALREYAYMAGWIRRPQAERAA